MRLLPAATLALAIALGAAGPAAASTVPRVDFSRGQTMVSVGLLDVNIDHAITDQVALGLSYASLGNWAAAARVTVRTGGDPEGYSWGWTASAGPGYFPFYPSSHYGVWAQLAATASHRVGDTNLFFRGTAGPVLTALFNPYGQEVAVIPYLFPIWINWEFAYRLSPSSELTFLGPNLVGYRGTF